MSQILTQEISTFVASLDKTRLLLVWFDEFEEVVRVQLSHVIPSF